MLKPVGANLLIKVVKKKSSIELLPGTKTNDTDLKILVEEVGTKCVLGVEKGHEVIIADKLSAVVVEQTDDHDLIIVPETAIKAVKNWEE